MATPTKPSFMPSFKKPSPVAPVTAPVTPAPVAVAPVVAPVTAPVEVEVPVPVATETEEALNIFESTEENIMSEEIATEEVAVEVVAVKKTRKKSVEGSTRKQSNRDMTKEDIEFIVANVKTMSYSEMAAARELTSHQINRVLMTVKKDLKKSCNEDPIALAKIDIYIRENLSRPEDSTGRSGSVKTNIEDIVGNILNSISSK